MKKRTHPLVILTLIVFPVLLVLSTCHKARGDTNLPVPTSKPAVVAPEPPPAPAPQPAQLPAPAPAPAPAATQPPPNPINLQTAIWIDDAMTRLHALQDQQSGTWASKIRALAAKYPTASLLILLRGFLGLFGLPIHTLLQGFLKRRGISPEKVSADTSAVFKQFDWIVNLITSVKPSLSDRTTGGIRGK